MAAFKTCSTGVVLDHFAFAQAVLRAPVAVGTVSCSHTSQTFPISLATHRTMLRQLSTSTHLSTTTHSAGSIPAAVPRLHGRCASRASCCTVKASVALISRSAGMPLVSHSSSHSSSAWRSCRPGRGKLSVSAVAMLPNIKDDRVPVTVRASWYLTSRHLEA